jgi:hypothetical protein
MFRAFLLVPTLALGLTIGLANSALAGVISVGGYTHNGTGYPGGDLGAAMLNPLNHANFGVDGFSDAGEVSQGGATAAYLSGVDIFFTGRSAISSGTHPDDVANLVAWVDAGGVLIVNNDRSTSFTALAPLLSAFSIGLISQSTPFEALTITDPLHPIMDGPFGTVGAMGLADASRYDFFSPDIDILATWVDGDGAIGVAGPGGSRLGAVILLPDVERFLLSFNSGAGTGDTEAAALNSVAYAVSVVEGRGSQVPGPSPIAILAFGMIGLGLIRRRRERAGGVETVGATSSSAYQ